jgi:hypothetical protein
MANLFDPMTESDLDELAVQFGHPSSLISSSQQFIYDEASSSLFISTSQHLFDESSSSSLISSTQHVIDDDALSSMSSASSSNSSTSNRVVHDPKAFVYVAEGGQIIRNNNLFKKVRTNKNSTYWMCLSSKCKESITVNSSESIIRETKAVHDHLPLVKAEIDCLIAIDKMFHRAKHDQRTSIQNIYAEEARALCVIHGHETIGKFLKPFSSFKTRLYEARKTTTPLQAATAEELVIRDEERSTCTGGPFLLFDEYFNESMANGGHPKRIVAFASNTGLSILAHSKIWMIDGTFKVKIF